MGAIFGGSSSGKTMSDSGRRPLTHDDKHHPDMLEKERRTVVMRETPFGILRQEYVKRVCPVCGEEVELESGLRWELKGEKVQG
jgi:hypothetical protein